MRAEALQYSPKSLMQAPTATEERSHGSPANTPLLPLKFKNTFTFAPFGLRKSRGNTNAPQRILNFCTFSACFALIRGYRGAPVVPEPPRCCQPIGNGSPQGKRERKKGKRKKGSDKPTSPQRKGSPPPLSQRAGSRSPHHKFAPKNQQKVALGSFEKIFGKIFRGNVSGGGRKTPRVISTEGVLTNENREISNLAMQ